jgi:DNA-binding Lrp family transcriptional regulator
MIDWWSETDGAIVECLRATGPMSPEELARRIGLSVGEISAFLAMLVREDRVRIRTVELTPEEERRRDRHMPVSIP